MVITRIEAYGYRCFPRLSVDFGRYHVLAGANGAGKTTLLDIPVLVGDMLRQQQIAAAFLERQSARGAPRASALTDVLHKGQGDEICLVVEARLSPEVTAQVNGPMNDESPRLDHVSYLLRLSVDAHGVRVRDERLDLTQGSASSEPDSTRWPSRQDSDAAPHRQAVIIRANENATEFIAEIAGSVRIPRLKILPSQLALGAVPADPSLFPAALWFADLLKGGVVFFEPDWSRLRRPSPPGDPAILAPSGQNIPWLALQLQASDPENFAAWIEHVRTALPQVADIRAVEREEDHFAYFAVTYDGGHRVTSSGLSDGTLRILTLTLLPFLHAETMPRLLVTEEPENGIHPRAIETVTQSLSSLYDSQVWVSTHSPTVLAHTPLAAVLAARLERDGGVSVVPGDQHPRLRDWRGSLDIGTLFAAGVLS